MKPSQIDHEGRDGTNTFDEVVHAGDAPIRVLQHRRESEQFGQQFPVNRETGRCGDTGSQGALIHRLVGAAQSTEIALQKLNGSHEIVRESRRLRELRVGNDGKKSVDVPAGQFQQQVLKRTDLAGGLEQLLAQDHPIKRDVDVVAAASNAQMPGNFAPTEGFEPSLDVKE